MLTEQNSSVYNGVMIMLLLPGVSHSQATIKFGSRWSTVKAFLRPAMKRLNLHVATLSHVTKVPCFALPMNFKSFSSVNATYLPYL